MTVQAANNWLLNEFSKFYLRDRLNLIIDSIDKTNFVQKLSEFISLNKVYAEDEIKMNFPSESANLIEQLNSLNYELLNKSYNALYDKVAPVIIPRNVVAIQLVDELSSNAVTFKNFSTDIFWGGLDSTNVNTRSNIVGALDCLTKIKDKAESLIKILKGL